MRHQHLFAARMLMLAWLVAVVALVAEGDVPHEAVAAETIDNLTIDVDATGNAASSNAFPVNTCIEVASSTAQVIDIVIGPIGVPAQVGVKGFVATLFYKKSVVNVSAIDVNQLLAVNPGSSPLHASDPTPNSDGAFTVAVADTGSLPFSAESGPGVLVRVTLSAIGSDVSPLWLRDAGVVDIGNDLFTVNRVGFAFIAVDSPGACSSDSIGDNDGVPTAVDLCPATPSGDPAGVNGCPPTEDYDGDALSDVQEDSLYLSDVFDPDTDNDGIWDGVDGVTAGGENATSGSANFTDAPGGATSGRIAGLPAGTAVTIADVAGAQGVRVVTSGSGGPALISLPCAPEPAYSFPAGKEAIITCDSLTTQVLVGPITVTFGSITAVLPTQSLSQLVETSPGVFTVTVSGGATITVGGLTVLPGQTVEVSDPDGDGLVNQADPDDDNDGALDTWDLVQCGGDPLNAGKRPERIDGAFAGIDDDADGSTDEPLPGGAAAFDCDGDGYSGAFEAGVSLCGDGRNEDNGDDAVVDDGCPGGPPQVGVFSEGQFNIGLGDQDPCGLNGWPSDFVTGGVPNSTNKVTLIDLTSFLGPVYQINTIPGNPNFNKRWDLVPGRGIFANWIALNDLTALLGGSSGSPDAWWRQGLQRSAVSVGAVGQAWARTLNRTPGLWRLGATWSHAAPPCPHGSARPVN